MTNASAASATTPHTENDLVKEFARRGEVRRQMERHLRHITEIAADVQRTMADLSAETVDHATVTQLQERLDDLHRQIPHRDRCADLVQADPISD